MNGAFANLREQEQSVRKKW